MAFPKKKTASQVYQDLVQEEQMKQSELINSSPEAKTALDRLNELQRNFKAAQEQGCFSDKFLRQIQDINELFDWFVAHVKEAVGIETAAIQYMAAYNACERGIAEKTQETDQILKDLDAKVAIKERELNDKLEAIKLEITTQSATLEASIKQNQATLDVETANYRKTRTYEVEQSIKKMLDEANEAVTQKWAQYRDDVRQLQKDKAEMESLHDAVAKAKTAAESAYEEGFSKATKEVNAAKEVALNSLKSKYDAELAMSKAKQEIAAEQIVELKKQLTEAQANLANVNAKLVEMATAQFKQPTVSAGK